MADKRLLLFKLSPRSFNLMVIMRISNAHYGDEQENYSSNVVADGYRSETSQALMSRHA
jgi:hypothetical protein